MEILKRNAPLIATAAALFTLAAVAYPNAIWEFFAGNLERTMVLATWILAFFAMLQLAVTRDAAHRQLRAYLFVHQDEAAPLVLQSAFFRFSAQLVLENSGQTPAYEIRHWTAFGVRGHPHVEKPFTKSESPTRATLAPGGDIGIPIEIQVTGDEWQAIFADTKRLYTWGEVIYRDAFGYQQVTRFRMVFSGLKDGRSHALQICDEGNEAT